MKMFFFRRYDESGTLLGMARRPLFQSELSVQIISTTNAMLPDTRLIIDGFFIAGTINGNADFKAAALSLVAGDLNAIFYRSDRETFHKVIADGTTTNGFNFADYTPVAPVVGAPPAPVVVDDFTWTQLGANLWSVGSAYVVSESDGTATHYPLTVDGGGVYRRAGGSTPMKTDYKLQVPGSGGGILRSPAVMVPGGANKDVTTSLSGPPGYQCTVGGSPALALTFGY